MNGSHELSLLRHACDRSDCKTRVPLYFQSQSQIQRTPFSVSALGFTSTPISALRMQSDSHCLCPCSFFFFFSPGMFQFMVNYFYFLVTLTL